MIMGPTDQPPPSATDGSPIPVLDEGQLAEHFKAEEAAKAKEEAAAAEKRKTRERVSNKGEIERLTKKVEEMQALVKTLVKSPPPSVASSSGGDMPDAQKLLSAMISLASDKKGEPKAHVRVNVGDEMKKPGLDQWNPKYWPTAAQVEEVVSNKRTKLR